MRFRVGSCVLNVKRALKARVRVHMASRLACRDCRWNHPRCPFAQTVHGYGLPHQRSGSVETPALPCCQPGDSRRRSSCRIKPEFAIFLSSPTLFQCERRQPIRGQTEVPAVPSQRHRERPADHTVGSSMATSLPPQPGRNASADGRCRALGPSVRFRARPGLRFSKLSCRLRLSSARLPTGIDLLSLGGRFHPNCRSNPRIRR